MSDYDRRGVTPFKIVAALIGLGMLGRRGQTVLTLVTREDDDPIGRVTDFTL